MKNPRLTHGQNPTQKTLMPFDPPSVSVDFVHVLQNFPKHSKTTLREKCVESQGTQLCC
jgi:hypothetical protein